MSLLIEILMRFVLYLTTKSNITHSLYNEFNKLKLELDPRNEIKELKNVIELIKSKNIL